MPVSFCPLASGSSGNSVYVSAEGGGVLVDAGLSGSSIERALFAVGKGFDGIKAILITHEHSDHVSGAGILSRRYDIPVYATAGTWEGAGHGGHLGRIGRDNRRLVVPGAEFYIGGLTVRAFDIPHDARQPVGYSFSAEGFKMAMATDVGEPSETVVESLSGSDVILIESNHDVDMLVRGKYPQFLKKRILGKNGHLSNVNAGLLICEVFSDRLKHIFLGHLSEENNRPLIAFDTVTRILSANEVRTNCEGGVRLSVAERSSASVLVELG